MEKHRRKNDVERFVGILQCTRIHLFEMNRDTTLASAGMAVAQAWRRNVDAMDFGFRKRLFPRQRVMTDRTTEV